MSSIRGTASRAATSVAPQASRTPGGHHRHQQQQQQRAQEEQESSAHNAPGASAQRVTKLQDQKTNKTMVRTMTVVVTTREWQLQESTLGISSMQGVKGVSLTMLIASKPSAVFLLTQSTRKISSQVLTAIIFHFDRQLLGNKTSFTPCSIYILLISNKFDKFWMSCGCRN